MPIVHPTALVSDGATLAPDVEVGPFCMVGPDATIGAGSKLLSHVVVENHVTIGERNTFHPFSVIGGRPQDLKFGGESARLLIGNDNTFRESVTLNIGTEHGTMETRIGNGCLFMALSHVAHDCVIGDRVIVANSVALAGHVHIADRVTLGGLAAVHQFCRIGRNAFIGGGAMVALDVPPFCIAQGDRAGLAGVNVVGLKRAGWNKDELRAVREAYKELFVSDSTRQAALERVEKEAAQASPLVKELTDFIRASARGVCAARSARGTEAEE